MLHLKTNYIAYAEFLVARFGANNFQIISMFWDKKVDEGSPLISFVLSQLHKEYVLWWQQDNGKPLKSCHVSCHMDRHALFIGEVAIGLKICK
jgi:hypothetical protein